MIIGISGRIGSGKDTVGKIICYLTAQQKLYKDWKHIENIEFDHSLLQFINNETPKTFLYDNVFTIKKFADKLKDMVCILIGCTREQLEDENFKNTELGEEWWVVKHDKLKDNIVFAYNKNKIYSNKHKLIKLTPRLLLQLLGTECGRNIIHPNIWCTSLFVDYKLIDGDISNSPYISKKQNNALKALKSYYPNWIITDVRFPNELEAIKDRGGISIRVNRYKGQLMMTGTGSEKTVNITPKEHSSEKALDNYKFDYMIDNNGSISDLIDKVKKILIKEKII